MNCEGTSCNQGRSACTSGCKPATTSAAHNVSPHEEAWDWISDLWGATRWVLIGFAVATIVLLLALRMGAQA